MNKMKYSSGAGVRCPIKGDGTEINSYNCIKCSDFVAVNRDTKVVVCDAELKCPKCGNHYESFESLTLCVKKCSCTHIWEYELYSMGGGEVELERKCSGCDKFEELCVKENDIPQEALRMMWGN